LPPFEKPACSRAGARELLKGREGLGTDLDLGREAHLDVRVARARTTQPVFEYHFEGHLHVIYNNLASDVGSGGFSQNWITLHWACISNTPIYRRNIENNGALNSSDAGYRWIKRNGGFPNSSIGLLPV